MKHVGVRSNAKDIASQEQLSALGDFKKDGSTSMTGGFNEAPPISWDVGFSSIIGATAINGTNTVETAGSSSITGMANAPQGSIRRIKLGGNSIFVQSGTFDLLTGANIQGSSGDIATFRSVGSSAWQMIGYEKANGASLAGDPNKLSISGGRMTGAINEAEPQVWDVGTGSVIGSAAVSAGNTIRTVGSSAITGLADAPIGAIRRVSLGGNSPITNGANLVLTTGADIAGRTNDVLMVRSIGTAQWQMIDYARADGTALVAAAGPASTDGLSEGATNLYFTQARVRATPVAGLSLADKSSVVAADTVLAAIGKLQTQITNNAFRVETIATTSVGQTSYAVPNGYTAGAVIVFFNGALLAPADYTATDGANVVLASGALTTSDIMSVIVIAAIRAQDDALLQYTVAALPAASANLAKQRWCTNMAGGAGVVVSNGTNWLRVADNTIVTV